MNERHRGTGGGLSTGLFLIFLTLKLLGVEPVGSWSWWWVASPLWGSIALAVFVACMFACLAVAASAFSGRSARLKDDE